MLIRLLKLGVAAVVEAGEKVQSRDHLHVAVEDCYVSDIEPQHQRVVISPATEEGADRELGVDCTGHPRWL